MDELLKAIKTLWNSSDSKSVALRAAAPGGLWLSQAPQSASGVYVVMTPVAAPFSYAMSTDAVKPFTEDCDIQFVFATLTENSGLTMTAEAAFKAVYHLASFTMTTQSLLVAKKLNERGPIRDDFTKGYGFYTEYRFMIGDGATAPVVPSPGG